MSKVQFRIIEVASSSKKHDAKLVLGINDTVANDLMYWMCGLKDLTITLDVAVEGELPFEIKEAVNYKPADAKEKPTVGYGVKQDVMGKQIGGDHYKKHSIQPWNIIDEFDLDFYEGNALKYLLRRKGDRIEDLQKAIHYLEKKIEDEKANNNG